MDDPAKGGVVAGGFRGDYEVAKPAGPRPRLLELLSPALSVRWGIDLDRPELLPGDGPACSSPTGGSAGRSHSCSPGACASPPGDRCGSAACPTSSRSGRCWPAPRRRAGSGPRGAPGCCGPARSSACVLDRDMPPPGPRRPGAHRRWSPRPSSARRARYPPAALVGREVGPELAGAPSATPSPTPAGRGPRRWPSWPTGPHRRPAAAGRGLLPEGGTSSGPLVTSDFGGRRRRSAASN